MKLRALKRRHYQRKAKWDALVYARWKRAFEHASSYRYSYVLKY